MSKGTGVNNPTPDVVLLYCEHCTAPGVAAISTSMKGAGFNAKLEMLPCSSKVETSYLLKILENGADGIELVTCPLGACRCLDGNVRAEKRVEFAKKNLATIGMGADRLGITRGACLTFNQLKDLAGQRAQAVTPLGINPMKGGHTR